MKHKEPALVQAQSNKTQCLARTFMYYESITDTLRSVVAPVGYVIRISQLDDSPPGYFPRLRYT